MALLTDFAFTTINTDDSVAYQVNPLKTDGIEKLAQLYIKILLTAQGSDLDNPNYGTRIGEIAGSITDKNGDIVRSKVVDAVVKAKNWLLDMQLNNPVDDDEMLKEVKIINIDYDLDSGKVQVTLYLLSISGKEIAFGMAI